MLTSNLKKLLTAALFLTGYSLAQADNVPNAANNNNANPATSALTPQVTNSNAIAFAVQAGSIAGAVQACGQDISVFVTRINEALNKLAANPGDKLMATSAFQRTLQQAQITQINSHPLQCSQVLQDYNGLPILRPDYEQTVLTQLSPGAATATNQAPTQNQLAPTAQRPLPANGQVPANNPAIYNPAPPPVVPTPALAPAPAAPMDQSNSRNTQN